MSSVLLSAFSLVASLSSSLGSKFLDPHTLKVYDTFVNILDVFILGDPAVGNSSALLSF